MKTLTFLILIVTLFIVGVLLLSYGLYDVIDKPTPPQTKDLMIDTFKCVNDKMAKKRQELLDLGFSPTAVEGLLRNRYLDEFYAECIIEANLKVRDVTQKGE